MEALVAADQGDRGPEPEALEDPRKEVEELDVVLGIVDVVAASMSRMKML